MQITFADQSVEYIRQLRTSRNPASPNTLKRYQSYLDARLVPQIGSRQLSELTGAACKAFFDPIADKLSASSLNGIYNVLIGVIDSAVDANGNQLYPRLWKKSFLDLPELVPGEQNTPEIPQKTLTEAILGGSPEDKRLWAFLAGSGLRIAECLAVRTTPDGLGNYWDRAAATVTVEVQRDLRDPDAHRTTKTAAGRRIVDLPRDLNAFLIRTTPEGAFLFTSKYDGLYKRLKKAIPDAGFHSFRRFRLTQIAAKNAPITLEHFWSGHAADGVHERYAKWATKNEERREWADKIGLGFELPQ
jgi:integrase